MPSHQEIADLLARNPYAQYLDEKAKAAEAEAAAAASLSDPNAAPTVHELVGRVLNAPPSSFYRTRHSRNKWRGTVKIATRCMVEKIGPEHFGPEQHGFRRVLREESKLKTHGLRAGLPQGLYNWLVDAGEPEGEQAEGVQKYQYFMTKDYLEDAKKHYSNCPKEF